MMRRTFLVLCAKPNFRRSSWEILGVDRMSTPDEIKVAYQKLISEHHPDKGGNNEEFQKVYNAYQEVLKGAPAHLLYGKETQKEKAEEFAKGKVEGLLSRLGLKARWEMIGNPHVNDRAGGSVQRKLIVAGSLYWFLVACSPGRPLYIFYLLMALGFDYVTGWVMIYFVFFSLLWYSLYSRQVPGFFSSGGAYWAFDRPNALTMAYGIPNYTTPQNQKVLPGHNNKGYRHLLEANTLEPSVEEVKSPMRRTSLNEDANALPLKDMPLKS